MTRYFFDFNDGTGLSSDEVGMEFDTLEAAQQEAAETLSEICKDAARAEQHHKVVSVHVRDDEGRQRFTAKMTFGLE